MRLFRVDENSKVTGEVETTERLAGVYDGIHVARKSGDGAYDLDYGNGNVLRINVKDGVPAPVGPDAERRVNLDDMPHRAWDRSTVDEQTKNPVSRFGALFGDGDDKDRPQNERGWDTSRPAAEEF